METDLIICNMESREMVLDGCTAVPQSCEINNAFMKLFLYKLFFHYNYNYVLKFHVSQELKDFFYYLFFFRILLRPNR